MRGTGDGATIMLFVAGITPACAGNSFNLIANKKKEGDHPRVCGEQPVAEIDEDGTIGSPPRVRGTGAGKEPRPARSRITPACAGNSASSTRCWRRSPDHPRVCGEQPFSSVYVCHHMGSPPRVRGTGSLIVPGNIEVGITPACAGNRTGIPTGTWKGKDHPRVCGEQMAPRRRSGP